MRSFQVVPPGMLVRGSLPRIIAGSSHLAPKQSIAPISVQLDIPITPQYVTLAAGAVNTNNGMTPQGLIPAWNTRLKTLFAECRLLGVKLIVRQNGVPVSTATGITAFYFDEKNTNVPTSATTLDHPRLELSNAPITNDKTFTIGWVANDLLDEDWTDCGTNITPVYLKTYSDQAAFGSSATTVTSFIITGSFRMQFRGLT